MSWFLTLFLSLLFVALAVDPASAEPISAAIAGITAIINAGGFAAVLIKGLIYVALSVGVSLLSKALAKQQDSTAITGVDLQIQMGDDLPVSFPLGTFAVAGKRKYVGTWGEDGKTPNAYLVDLVEISNMPIDSVNGFWVNDEKVTIDFSRPHADGRGYPIAEYRDDGKDYMWVKFVFGTQTVVDPYMFAKFGNIPDRPWTTQFIGQGNAYAVITCRYNSELFSSLPTWLFEPGSIRLYDIRKDSTNGGSGSHRWGDYSTYEPSSNPMVGSYNIIRGIYYNGVWMYGGQNLAAFRLPASAWIAAMNAADEGIPLLSGGTEPAFRFGYEISGEQKPTDVLVEILKGANARIAEVGGSFKPLVSSPGAAVYSFTDGDIVVTKEQGFDPFPSLDQTYNGIEATYPEPAEKWSSKDAPARYDATLEVADGSRRLPAGVSFVSVPFATQVQRLMLAMIQDYRRFRVHQIYLPPDAYALEPNDVVSWTSVRNGYDNKKFVITQISGDRTFNQLATIKEVDPSDYDWAASDTLPTAVGWIGTITAPPQPMYGWVVEPAIIYDSNGLPWKPSIRVSAAPDQDAVRNVWVQVRNADDDEIIFDSQSTPYASPYSWIIQRDFKSNSDYEVRGKFIPKSDRVTEWSEWLSVTTPTVANTDLVVFLNNINKEVLDVFERLFDKMDDLRPLYEQLAEDFQVDVATAETARRTITQTVGNNKAEFDEQIIVLVNEDQALATQITTLSTDYEGNKATVQSQIVTVSNAQSATAATVTDLSASVASTNSTVNDISVQGRVKFAVAANQSGVDARFSVLIRSSVGVAYKETGFFLELYTEGGVQKTRFAVLADQFVVTDGGTYTLPLVFSGGVLRLQNIVVNGALIEDATIGSAKIGDLQVTTAKIGYLQVGTSNIQSGAVTTINYASGPAGASGLPYILDVILSHGTDIQNVEITASGGLYVPPGGGFVNSYIYSITDGTLLAGPIGAAQAGPASGGSIGRSGVSIIAIHNPPARASTTYRIQFVSAAGEGVGGASVTSPIIFAKAFKR